MPATTRRAVLTAGLGMVSAPLTGCRTDDPVVDRLVVAGGEPGGTLIRLSRLIAGELLRQGVVGHAPVDLTQGSVENLDRLRAGKADVALSHADVAVTSGHGLVAIARAYQTMLHCLVRAEDGVSGPEELVGRRVAIGPVRSGTAETATRLLRTLGAEDRGGSWVHATPANGAIMLGGGTVDAMFWWGGLPAPEIRSVGAVRPFRALDLSSLVGPANTDVDGVYDNVRLPGSVYGQEDVRTIGVGCFLMCRSDLPDPMVAALVDLVIDSGRALVPQPLNGLRYLLPGTLFDTTPVALHPAAAARYRERHR